MPTVSEEPSIIESALYELYETVLQFATGSGIWLVGVVIALFALYAVHTLTVWLSGDPERAFHSAKMLAGYTSTAWNTAAGAANALADTGNELLPSYNMLVEHTVQPVIWTGLEVASLVFFQQHYEGMISEDVLPFEGHDCAALATADEDPRNAVLRGQWCGDVEVYAAHLGVVEGTGANIIENGTTLIMNTPTARRLQSLMGVDALSSGASLIGVLPIQPLLDVVEDISGVVIELVATGADVFFDVVYTILEEVAVLIFNLIMTIARATAEVIMQVVQSGILQNILKMGMDILMVLLFNVALPLLFATMDLIMCLMNLLQPATWGPQLQCIETKCFMESGDIGAEIFTTFTSIPIIAKQMSTTLEALLNPTTGRRYGGATSGGTQTPELDPGSLGGAAASTCAACFSCKVESQHRTWLSHAPSGRSNSGCVGRCPRCAPSGC